MPALPATASQALSALRSRSLGALELIDAAIALIEASTLGAVELLDADRAREQARRADRALARGGAGGGGVGPLTGLPLLVKDVIDVAGLPTRAGTAAWRGMPAADAAAVAALRREGAIVLGKGHTNELAFGIDGRNPHRPPCVNPHDRGALPGGSSSGPAAALAGGLILGALGTDTSGSIRVPAALCGVAGLRPSHERISRRGVLALAPSYDVVGPMAPCVADLRPMFAALARGASGASSGERMRAAADPAPIVRVRLIEDLLDPAVCDPAIARVLREAADALRSAGVEVDSVSVPELEDALAVHRHVQLPQAAESVRALGVPREELGEEVRQRLRAARQIDAASRQRALRRRAQIAHALERAMGPRGALLAPGCAVTAPQRTAEHVLIGAGGPSRSIRDALLACTVPLTQAAGPVLAMPIGVLRGMPVGAQLLARWGSDERLLELGARWEDALATVRPQPGAVTIIPLPDSAAAPVRP